MPPYSLELVRERSPFWYPRRALTITGRGTYDDPYVVPGSPMVECPPPRPNAPSLAAIFQAKLLEEELKRMLRLGSQEGSINYN